MLATKQEIIDKLRQDLLRWQGFEPPKASAEGSFGLPNIEASFPNNTFPTAALHEFISYSPQDTAATGGFMSGIIKTLLAGGGACLWVSATRRIYPPALKQFGLDPDRVVFVDVSYVKDILWVMEEALKCEGIGAVVCETRDLSFMESRRLQLAVEKHHITGFILRKDTKKVNPTTCVARWKVSPVRSKLRPGMPGVGFPRWKVELLRVKNGSPGSWTVEWKNRQFCQITETQEQKQLHQYA
ncbi:MAG: Error-prone repair protein ImuA [Bacteroidetes bacterium]|nr:Error-prone repair protein ImuA [Bacteroidota bacterium]